MKFTWNTFIRAYGAVLAVVVLYSAFRGDGLFCPDCPDPVVDTGTEIYPGTVVYKNPIRQYLADSIAVLNALIPTKVNYWKLPDGWDTMPNPQVYVSNMCADSIAKLNEALEFHRQNLATIDSLWKEEAGKSSNHAPYSVLKREIDSLKQHIEWLWALNSHPDAEWVDTVDFRMLPGPYELGTLITSDPCAGTVSIAAVDSLLGLYRKVESYTTRFGAWTLRLPDNKAKYEFSEYAICDTTYHFEPDLWGRWQRLKDRGQ